MPCYHPMHAYRSSTVNPSGKRGITFDATKGTIPITLSCGQCIGCRLSKARDWSIRILHEAQFHEQKVFLTLTYSDIYVPHRGMLCKRDVQLFLKRLRKEHGGKIRFFGVGEYGDQNDRPHYHLILFGCDFSDRTKYSNNDGNTLWTSKDLDRIWGKGKCWIGQVTLQSADYVARYCIKKINGQMADEHYKRVDPETGEIFHIPKEYIHLSQGFGKKFYEKFKSDLYPSDFIVARGQKAPIPKYYDRILEKEDPAQLAEIKQSRQKNAKKRAADNTPQRLAVRKEIKIQKLTRLIREL